MLNIKARSYGTAAVSVAVIHGGPGAAGAMAPVALELSAHFGVLEPMQTATTVAGQIEELKAVLESQAPGPITLIGHSWGAWLAYLLAAKCPKLVSKLILVGSGPFEAHYANNLMQVRRSRLSYGDNILLDSLLSRMQNADGQEKSEILKEFGKVMSKAESYDPIPEEEQTVEFNLDVFNGVWPEANNLRKTGELLELGKQIKCPVVAIHGDYDSHPHEGVHFPLRAVLQRFKFIILEKCGHTPWTERYAKEDFYSVLRDELRI